MTKITILLQFDTGSHELLVGTVAEQRPNTGGKPRGKTERTFWF